MMIIKAIDCNPEIMLKEADIFCVASEIILKSASDIYLNDLDELKIMWLNDASSVNHAYAFEIYLKCLLVIEGKDFSSSHVLKDLFNQLSIITKDKIISHYKSNVSYTPAYFAKYGHDKKIDFVSKLELIPQPFIGFRYKFDPNNKYRSSEYYDLESLIFSVRAVIFELSPNLKGIIQPKRPFH